MAKLLITGSNGLLGQKLLFALKKHPSLSVIATSLHEDKTPVSGNYQFEPLDITNPAQVQKCFARHRPEIVIHTAAMTQVDLCEENQELCWNINVEGTKLVVRECEAYRSHLIHLSTDFIFDGTNGPYREEDIPHPLNFYGTSKWGAEKLVQQSRTSWAIVRTILVYGYTPALQRSNLVLLVKKRLEQGQTVQIVKDQYRMPTLAEDLAAACLTIAEQKTEGIFHVSGNETLSIFDFALKIAEIYGLNSALIQPVPTEALKEKAKRPATTGFLLQKASDILRFSPHSIEEGLRLVAKQLPPLKKAL